LPISPVVIVVAAVARCRQGSTNLNGGNCFIPVGQFLSVDLIEVLPSERVSS